MILFSVWPRTAKTKTKESGKYIGTFEGMLQRVDEMECEADFLVERVTITRGACHDKAT